MKKLKHLLGFHGELRKLIDTGEYEFKYVSPFDLFITQFWHYRCPDCGRLEKIPSGDYLDMCFKLDLYDLQLKVAQANADIGDYDTAIKVLKIK